MSRRQKRDALAHQLERALLGADFFGPGFEFVGAGYERAEVETEGQLDVASPAFAGVALAVGAVAADHQAAIDQRRQMPPQRRRRHAMRPQRQLLVGREDDEVLAGQRGLRVEAQQRVEHRQRAFGHADPRLGRAYRAKDLPFVNRLLGRPRFRDRLARHMGKRQRSPPEGRRR